MQTWRRKHNLVKISYITGLVKDLFFLLCLIRKKNISDSINFMDKKRKNELKTSGNFVVIVLSVLAAFVVAWIFGGVILNTDKYGVGVYSISGEESYFCFKHKMRHTYSIDSNAGAGSVIGSWCRKCCMMGTYQSTNPPLIHCCKCVSNHRGECLKDYGKCEPKHVNHVRSSEESW